MVFKVRRGDVRARLLAGAALAAVTLISALAAPGVAAAATISPTDTTSLVTLHGTTDQLPSPGCTRLTTADGSTYELRLPQNPTPDQRNLIMNGIPLNAPVEVQAKQLSGAPSACGPVVEVESLTELIAFQGTTQQSATPGCTTLVTDRGMTLELRLPQNPSPDQQKLVQDGIPLGDLVQVDLKPIGDQTRWCSTTVHTLEVESLTILQETLDGMTDALQYCPIPFLTTTDGTVYSLQPAPGTDPVPRGVRVEITAKPLPAGAVPCGATAPALEVESFTVLPPQETTLDGTASQIGATGSCTQLITTDGSSYELQLQTGMPTGPASGPAPVTSIPLGVPIEVDGATGTGATSNCGLGPIVVVQSLTVLDN